MTHPSLSNCPPCRVLALIALCWLGTAAAQPKLVDIGNGDFAALQNALCDAQRRTEERTVIFLAERGYYTPTRPVGSRPPRWQACLYSGNSGNIPIGPGAGAIATHVVIVGNNATLDFEGDDGFGVSQGGHLQLEAVELRNSRVALVVDGRAELQRVSVVGAHPGFPDARAPVLNRGELVLRNTVIGSNRIGGVPADLIVATDPLDRCADTATAGVLNEGRLVANNVTLVDNEWAFVDLPAAPTGSCVTSDLLNLPGAEARFGNSLLASRLFAGCAGTVTSLGYNSVPGGSTCGFDGPGDVVADGGGVFAFVRHEPLRQLDRQMFRPGGDRLQAGSPEAAGTSPSACEPLDVRGALRAATPGGCDRGAYDLGAAPAFDSGIDGLWVDPDNDGQYLHIDHYGRNRVLLVWNGFDDRGEQIWVYGLAFFEAGNRVETGLYRNAGVRLVDGRLEGRVEALHWGELSAESVSCNTLRLRLESADFNGDAAEYRMIRLTGSATADCAD